MEVIYGLLPGMLLLGIIGVGVFFWAVRSGQYDDMEGSANRVLMDDEEGQKPHRNSREDQTESSQQVHQKSKGSEKPPA